MVSSTLLLLLLPFLALSSAAPANGTPERDVDIAERHVLAGQSGHGSPKYHIARGESKHIKKIVRRRKNKRSTCGTASSSVVSAGATASNEVLAASSAVTSPSSITAASSIVSAAVSSETEAASTTAAATAAVTASSTASSSAAASTSAASNTSSTGSLLDELFPPGYGSAHWTTDTDASDALSFTGALKPLTAGSLPKTATAPDGSSALVANYPAGTYDYSSSTGHGFSFYSEGSHNSVAVESAKEMLFSYSVFFPADFNFNKGGKMPGFYGGTSLAEAKSCSGGRQTDRDECFSARLMFRTDGMGEFYNYYPMSVTQGGGYCNTAPLSVCDTVYGDSIGRGSFSWSTGKWTTVAQRIKLNDVGSQNGEQELWVDGVQIMSLTGLEIAVSDDTKIYGIMAQTFFGGHDSTWASPQDQSAYFKDWSLAVLA
ncbi:hypothetical protein P7C73_g6620, partial [Tremellales sp. Uapishka_1]